MSPGRSHPGEECALLSHPCHGNGTPPPPRTTAAGLAPRAARKGGTSQARGHTSAALVALATEDVAKCAVSKQQRVLSSVPLTHLIHQQRTLDWIKEGSWGVPGSVLGCTERKGTPRVLEGLAPEKGSPCHQPVPLPQQKAKAGAGSRKLGKDREVSRPHSGAVITGTCPSRPRLPLSLSHFFPCWKVPVP